MKVTGKKINSMVMDLKHGQMVQNIKDSMFKERNMVLESLLGLMEAHIMVTLLKITFKEKENTTGLMVENTMEIG